MVFGIVMVSLSAIVYGVIPLITKTIYEFGFDAISISFFRFFLMIPILLVICIIKNKSLKIGILGLLNIFLFIALPSGLTMLLLNESYNYISIGTATTLHFLYPAFVILICIFYYHQEIERKILIPLLMIMIGISCFMDRIDYKGIFGIILAFLSAITYAIYLVQLEQKKFYDLDPMVLSLYTSICISITLGIIGFFSKSLLFESCNYDNRIPLYFIILSFFSMIAIVSLQIGTRYLGAKLTALFSLLEPITSIVTGVVCLQEELHFLKIIGCLFILIAMLNIIFSKSKNKKKNSKMTM